MLQGQDRDLVAQILAGCSAALSCVRDSGHVILSGHVGLTLPAVTPDHSRDMSSALISLPPLGSHLTLTAETATKIVDAIAQGSSRHAAAHLAGVPASTLTSWLDMANTIPNHPCRVLLDAILKAEALYESQHIQGATTKARSTDDHLKLLEKHPSHRERWGSQDEKGTTIVVHVGVSPQVPTSLSPHLSTSMPTSMPSNGQKTTLAPPYKQKRPRSTRPTRKRSALPGY